MVAIPPGQAASGKATPTLVLSADALEELQVSLFQRIGAAEAGDVSRELAALTEAGPPG
jgi:hypothetical protein